MNSVLTSPEWMISRAIAFASGMSVPTSSPSQRSAHCAEAVRRGSTTISFAPRLIALQHVVEEDRVRLARVRAPEDDQVRVSDLLVGARPPPAPNTVARPTTLGACQVRLQLSTLLECRTTRENFCAAKLSSFVAFEQLKRPGHRALRPRAFRKPAAARSSASSQLASLSSPPSRTSGCVSLA